MPRQLHSSTPGIPDTQADLTSLLQSLPSLLQSRREFIKLAGLGLGFSTLTACGGGGGGDNDNTDEAPTPPVLPAASPEYTALKRTSFGPQPAALSAIQSMGINAYLEQQLDYDSIDDGALESDIQRLFPLTTRSPAELIAGFPQNIAAVAQQMVAATQYRQIFSQRQLYEVMVEFWSDHFNIHLVNGLGPTLKPEDDRQVIRTHALGNFRDLLGASARSPAMLFYLDNFFNVASAPNENYARELMELHTLGVDGGYTEQDVKEVARCFTGWTIRFPGDPSGDFGTYKFEPTVHDTGPKVVLGYPIAGAGGENDAEQVLDILANHPSTARFIATKLCRRFITDDPDPGTVDTVAAAFSAAGGNIRSTLRALFATPAFSDSADTKFIRPSEYLAGAIRALAPKTNYPSDNGLLFFFAQSILGQLPFYWPTPDGYPDRQDYWANTGGMLNRWRLSFLSYAPYIPSINVFQIDYSELLDGADTLNTVIDTLTDKILLRPLANEDRTILVDWLTGLTGKSATETLSNSEAETIAPGVAAVFISSAYFQLR